MIIVLLRGRFPELWLHLDSLPNSYCLHCGCAHTHTHMQANMQPGALRHTHTHSVWSECCIGPSGSRQIKPTLKHSESPSFCSLSASVSFSVLPLSPFSWSQFLCLLSLCSFVPYFYFVFMWARCYSFKVGQNPVDVRHLFSVLFSSLCSKRKNTCRYTEDVLYYCTKPIGQLGSNRMKKKLRSGHYGTWICQYSMTRGYIKNSDVLLFRRSQQRAIRVWNKRSELIEPGHIWCQISFCHSNLFKSLKRRVFWSFGLLKVPYCGKWDFYSFRLWISVI